MDYIALLALLASKKSNAEEFRDNPWLNLAYNALDAGQTAQLGAVSFLLKGVYAGIKPAKGSFKYSRVADKLKANVLEIERFFNILGCMMMFYRIFADHPEGYFEHAMNSNYMCVVMDKREMETDPKRSKKRMFKNDSGFLLCFDKVDNIHAPILCDCIQACPEKWIALKELFDSNFKEAMRFEFREQWVDFESIGKSLPTALKMSK